MVTVLNLESSEVELVGLSVLPTETNDFCVFGTHGTLTGSPLRVTRAEHEVRITVLHTKPTLAQPTPLALALCRVSIPPMSGALKFTSDPAHTAASQMWCR